jgi:hypothetical protein
LPSDHNIDVLERCKRTGHVSSQKMPVAPPVKPPPKPPEPQTASDAASPHTTSAFPQSSRSKGNDIGVAASKFATAAAERQDTRIAESKTCSSREQEADRGACAGQKRSVRPWDSLGHIPLDLKSVLEGNPDPVLKQRADPVADVLENDTCPPAQGRKIDRSIPAQPWDALEQIPLDLEGILEGDPDRQYCPVIRSSVTQGGVSSRGMGPVCPGHGGSPYISLLGAARDIEPGGILLDLDSVLEVEQDASRGGAGTPGTEGGAVSHREDLNWLEGLGCSPIHPFKHPSKGIVGERISDLGPNPDSGGPREDTEWREVLGCSHTNSAQPFDSAGVQGGGVTVLDAEEVSRAWGSSMGGGARQPIMGRSASQHDPDFDEQVPTRLPSFMSYHIITGASARP